MMPSQPNAWDAEASPTAPFRAYIGSELIGPEHGSIPWTQQTQNSGPPLMNPQPNTWDVEAPQPPFSAYIGSEVAPEHGSMPWSQQAQNAATPDASKWKFRKEPSSVLEAPPPPPPIPSVAEGAAGAMLKMNKDQSEFQNFPTYGIAPTTKKGKAKPFNIGLLIALLLVPWVIFIVTFALMSFRFRYSSNVVASVLAYLFILPTIAFLGMAIAGPKESIPLTMLISLSCLAAWIFGLSYGNQNYQQFMFPYYNVNNLNTYDRIDPLAYTSQQVMDAGKLQFVGGSAVLTSYSVGFKNGNVYCVAPIGLAANATQKQKAYDFWAVGVNCCSGHLADFQCGDYADPKARWGLRVMRDTDRSMYEVAVKSATAAYNIHANQPIFLHWLTDPVAEVQSFSDDGTQHFITSIFGFFGVQLFVTVVGAAMTQFV